MSKHSEYLIIGLLWLIVGHVADTMFMSVAACLIAIVYFILSIVKLKEQSNA